MSEPNTMTSDHYNRIIDELLADISSKGVEAMTAMAQAHQARSKGDDRAEQMAEKWREHADSLPRGVAVIMTEIRNLRAELFAARAERDRLNKTLDGSRWVTGLVCDERDRAKGPHDALVSALEAALELLVVARGHEIDSDDINPVVDRIDEALRLARPDETKE